MAIVRYRFRFRDLDLDGALVSWNDAFAVRLARHSYLKRSGAEQEPMGAEAGRFTMRLSFVGPAFATQYRALVASIRQDPLGLLVHPLLGQLRVACTGISDAACEPGRARNAIDVTVGFEEDALDAAFVTDASDSPLAAAGRIASATARFKAASARFPRAATQAASLVSSTSTFSTAAQAAAAGAVDVSLLMKLAAVGIATDAAVEALLGDPLARRAAAFAAVSRAVEIYGACVQLDRVVAASRPPIIEHRVDGPVNLFVLAARLYGAAQARARAQEILAINRIPDPAFIPPGFRLRIARPTV